MSGHSGCQINGTGTFRAVKTPNSLGVMGIHVDGFTSVAPTGRYADSEPNTFAFKFFGAGCSFGHTAYGAVCNNAFHGGSVAVFQRGRNQFGHSFGHIHGLHFEAFSHASFSPVNYGTYSYFGMFSHNVLYFNIVNDYILIARCRLAPKSY
jgi:hypothetical protein